MPKPKFDKTQYVKGMHLTGGEFPADGYLIADARRERPSAGSQEPRDLNWLCWLFRARGKPRRRRGWR